MKKTYTQFFKVILALFLGVFGVSSASAQYTIEVDGQLLLLEIGRPGYFAGDAIDAPIAVADNNCSPTNVSGAIAILDPDLDTCDPGAQLTAAHDNGAVGVIICGLINTDGDLFTLQYEENEAGDIISGIDIDIPTYTASAADCEIMKVSTQGILDLQVTECDTTMPDNIVWGAGGEGQFDGGLNDWAISNDQLMRWDAKGQVDRGYLVDNGGQILSPTLCNGAVVAEGAFADNEGLPDNFGNGPCPAPTCTGTLSSPAMDLSAATGGLVLRFYQSVANFDSDYTLLVNVDGLGGNEFEIPFNEDLVQFQITPGFVEIPLPAAVVGESNVIISFEYTSNYYYWAIDDVYVIQSDVRDVRVNSFASHAINYETPASQSDMIPLLADIENNGNVAIDGGTLTATLTNDLGEILDEATLEYGEILPGVIDQNRLFNETFAMPTTPGTYAITYSLVSAEDENLDNNTQQFTFIVGGGEGNVFSKCDDTEATNAISFPDTEFFSLGAGYHVENALSPGGTQMYITSLKIGASVTADNAVDGNISVGLYEWNDFDLDGIVDLDDDTGIPERVLLFQKSYLIFAGEAQPDLANLTIDLGDDKVALKDNQNYLVVMHGNPLNEGEQYLFMAADAVENTSYDYGASAFAFGRGSADGVIPDVNTPGETTVGTITDNPIEMSRIGSVGGTGTSAEDNHTRQLSAVNNFAALAEMHITNITSTEDINEDIAVSVFPNPAKNNIYVDLALENVSENVNLQVVDIQGKIVMTQNFANVKADKLQLNIANLNTGIYVVNIRTEEGFTSARFVKD